MRRHTLLCGKRGLGLAMAFVLCSSLSAYAAPTPVDPRQPDAGRISDSVKERRIAIPLKDNVQIEVSGDQAEAQPAKEGFKFLVNGFRISGITAINELALREDKLQELVKDATNKDLTLTELEAVARKVAKKFRAEGYLVANAYIPAQDIQNGIVEITVVPGKYGSIELRNHSRLSDVAARKLLGNIKVGNYVKKAKLERTLLLMSDTGGISIKATLAPGQATGTTALIVDISNTDALTADLSMDNYGNRFTGKNLRNLDLDAHNLSGNGDQARLKVNNSGGGLTNAGVEYTLPIGGQGLKAGLGYERLHYSLGQEFEILNAWGEAKNANIFVSYPLIRSRNYNLYAQLGYTDKQLEDRIDGQQTYTQRSSNVWTLGLSGDKRDELWGGGVNSFALSLASGRLNIDGGRYYNIMSAKEWDDAGARTAGRFTKTNLYFNRLQHINERMNLLLGFSGQLASKNLDSAEKMYLGGAYGVRAYPQGEASGDQGYLLNAELRYQTNNPALQLTAFLDYGHVTINKNPWGGAGDNSRSLSGTGIGAIYGHNKDYYLRLDYAWKLGSEEATSDTDKNGRLWLRGVQYF